MRLACCTSCMSTTILHIGWNLALMDHLNMARYDMLKQYWG